MKNYSCFLHRSKNMLCTVQGGFLLAKPMREKGCVTMMDPFQAKYGRVVTTAMSVVSLMAEMFCLPATLVGLGASFMFNYFLYSKNCIHVGGKVIPFTHFLHSCWQEEP